MAAEPATGACVLSPELARIGAALLHQQCWCWGCDIRRPEGNLLLRFGFERCRPPQRDCGSSRYTIHLHGNARLHLWGFGAAWQDGEGATFVARYEFQPAPLVAGCLAAEIRAREQLLFQPLAQDVRLLSLAHAARFCRFNAAYETWVLQTVGFRYRQECIEQWEKFSVGAGEFAEAWACLAGLIEGFREALPAAAEGRF